MMTRKVASVFFIVFGALIAALNSQSCNESDICYEGSMYFTFFMKAYLALCVVLLINVPFGEMLLPFTIVSAIIVLVCGAHIQPRRIQCLIQDIKQYCILLFIFVLAVSSLITYCQSHITYCN